MARYLLFLTAVLGSLTLAVGCGDDDDENDGPVARQQTQTSEKAATATRTEAKRAEGGERKKNASSKPKGRKPEGGKGKKAARSQRPRRRLPLVKNQIPRRPRDESQVRKLRACLERQRAKTPSSEDFGPEPMARCLKVSQKELRAQFLKGCRALARRKNDERALRRCPAQARRFFEGSSQGR